MFNSVRDAAAAKNINTGHLFECRNGKHGRKTAGVYHLEHIKEVQLCFYHQIYQSIQIC